MRRPLKGRFLLITMDTSDFSHLIQIRVKGDSKLIFCDYIFLINKK